MDRAGHHVTTMCRVLDVSPSGYYAWRKRQRPARQVEDTHLRTRIRASHQASRGAYGRARIHADLADEGWRVGGKRMGRLMRMEGIRGVARRKGAVTTAPAAERRPQPDLVERDFTASAPDQLYVADITYIPTQAGLLYLAMVMDVFSRCIVDWRMATHLRAELVRDALDMALWQRRPQGVIHHSDQAASTRPSISGSAAARPVCGLPWDRWATAMTTPWPRAFSPRWNSSCWINIASRIPIKPAGRCSSTSKAGTTPIDGTRPSGISHPATSSGSMRASQRCSNLNVSAEAGKPTGTSLDRSITLTGYRSSNEANSHPSANTKTQVDRDSLSLVSIWSQLKIGAPGRIRTCGLWLRRPALYPTELRALFQFQQRDCTLLTVVRL